MSAPSTQQQSVNDPESQVRARASRYKVRTGMLGWILHRVTGIGLVLYLIIHVWGLRALTDPASFNALIAKYHSPIFKIGEFVLLIGVAYHALNGLRIVLIDFLGWSPRQKKLFWTLGAVCLLIIVVGGYPSLSAIYHYLAS